MRTRLEVEAHIEGLKREYAHILTGERALLEEAVSRCLLQLRVETELDALHWVLGKVYKSKLKGAHMRTTWDRRR